MKEFRYSGFSTIDIPASAALPAELCKFCLLETEENTFNRVVTKSKTSGEVQNWSADVIVISAPIPALQR